MSTESKENVQPLPQLAGNDAFIANVVSRQPLQATSITVGDTKFDLYELPPSAKEMKEKGIYSYKWVGKTERQVQRATEVEGWVLCTRANSTYIPASFFKVHGAVEKGGMLLAFMSSEGAVKRNQKYRDIHNQRKQAVNSAHKQPGFYKAKLSPAEEENQGAGDFQQGSDGKFIQGAK
jgi:hypothetical protein